MMIHVLENSGEIVFRERLVPQQQIFPLLLETCSISSSDS
jgi:hypothetical protein